MNGEGLVLLFWFVGIVVVGICVILVRYRNSHLAYTEQTLSEIYKIAAGQLVEGRFAGMTGTGRAYRNGNMTFGSSASSAVYVKDAFRVNAKMRRIEALMDGDTRGRFERYLVENGRLDTNKMMLHGTYKELATLLLGFLNMQGLMTDDGQLKGELASVDN